MRLVGSIAMIIALGGCGKLFGIADIPYAGDGGTDAANPTDAAMIDAPAPVARIQIASPSYDFGGVTIGTMSFSLSIEVSNVGTGSTAPLGMTRAGDGADFAVSNDGCTNTALAVGATCTFKVTFSPGAAGARASTFVVADPSVSAETIFKGVGLTAGALEISPSPFDFGTQPVGGTTPARSFSVTNTGNTSLSLVSIAITSGATFGLNTSSCGPLPRILPPNASCQVAVAFNPHIGGTQTSSLTVTSDAAANNTASTSLGGTGSAMVTVTRAGGGTGSVRSSDLAIDCGTTCAATFTTSSVTLTATPANGSSFDRWMNCASPSGVTCSVPTDAASTTIGAAFSQSFTLTILPTGSQGVVMGAGITCQSGTDTCTAHVPAGTDVRLTPIDVGRSRFNLWTSGPCFTQNINSSGTFPDCTFTMTTDITVGADFADDATINFIPDPGSIVGNNAHIDLASPDRNGQTRCRTVDPFCTFHFVRQTNEKASAASDECATFHHFTGGGCGLSRDCEVMPVSEITTINYFYVVSPGNLCFTARPPR
jgi:hypothetical protein